MSEWRRTKALVLINEKVVLKDARVVDVGSGDGGLVRQLTQLGAQVTGVECGAAMLAAAHAAPKVGSEVYLEGVGQGLPIEDASADVVVFMNSLHHVPVEHMGAALREAARVLKPGGVALVNEPLPEGKFFQLTRLVDDETVVRAEAQKALLAALADGVFTRRETALYLNPVRFDGFEPFAKRMGLIDPSRAAKVGARLDELRGLFEALGERRDGGWCFDQPARLDVLEKVGA